MCHMWMIYIWRQNHSSFSSMVAVNIGAEALMRITFFQYAFIEYCNKLDYACITGCEFMVVVLQ